MTGDGARYDAPRDPVRGPAALGDRAARLAVERAGRAAREQDRDARRGDSRRGGVLGPQRCAEAAGRREGRACPPRRCAGRAQPAPQPGTRRRPAVSYAWPRRFGWSESAFRRSRHVPRRSSGSTRRSGAGRRSDCGGSTSVSDLAPEVMRPLLAGSLGKPYLYSVETPSTQDLLTEDDLPHGAVAVTEHQTAGRGRSGRRWDDAPSRALLFSVLLRPPGGAPLPQLSLVAGLAVANALEARGGRAGDGEVAERRTPRRPQGRGDPARGVGHARRLRDRDQRQSGRDRASRDGALAGHLAPAHREPDVRPGRDSRGGARRARGAPTRRGSTEVWPRFSAAWRQRNAVRGRRVRVSDRTGIAGEIAADGRLTITLDRGDVVLVESGEVELAPGETLTTG